MSFDMPNEFKFKTSFDQRTISVLVTKIKNIS